ncbi:MAG TPA: ATP-dependent DNA helicase [Bacteroidales bacterium]|nr:ATP-dependent DNA helicase [Bacteroidales bacterium]
MTTDIFSQLNDSQAQAVRDITGPSLVIAGAGSGKTRVLTYKIAYLIEQGMKPGNILALTFTNKAAREMQSRIEQLLPGRHTHYLWMGTFHHICSRILRVEAQNMGYTRDFTIYDTDDTKNLLKRIVKDLKLDDKLYKASTLYNRISAAKNALISPRKYSTDHDITQRDQQARLYRMAEIYAEYNKRLKASNAMDFDDLLYNTNVLLRDFPDILRKYQEIFQFILVDEYQDTNFSQYLIVRKLAELHHRICVVGDDAQSIYSFRGANIYNILNFQQQYPESKLYKLEQNYRSTQNIVSAANSLISHNKNQIPKQVYSMGNDGEVLHILKADTDTEEAELTARNIVKLQRRDINLENIAMLYRTNAQSRVLEQVLRKYNIPYRVYGGHSFYQRREIKDALAYMRLLVNNRDEESLTRIINVPARGIGPTTVNKILLAARQYDVPAWHVLLNPMQYHLDVNAGTHKKLAAFTQLINNAIEDMRTNDAYNVAKNILEHSGLMADAAADDTPEGISRHENLQELLTGIHEFEEQQRQINDEQTILLSDFLSTVALQTDQDDKEDDQSEKVTMMTIHAAKGLEYDVIFVLGLEEGLFPSDMSQSEDDVEEERRLFYVAITRAKKYCYLGFAAQRFRNGKTTFCVPSRFLSEIDDKYIDKPQHLFRKQSFTRQYSGRYDYDFEDELDTWNNIGDSHSPFPSQTSTTYTPATRQINKTPVGSAYVKGNRQQAQSSFTAGMRVCHAVFGKGTITDIYTENDNVKIEIMFDEGGKKTMLEKFARLTVE